MRILTELFLSKDLTQQLRDLGCNADSFGYFIEDTLVIIGVDIDTLIENTKHQKLQAIMYNQAIDWLLDEISKANGTNTKIEYYSNKAGFWQYKTIYKIPFGNFEQAISKGIRLYEESKNINNSLIFKIEDLS